MVIEKDVPLPDSRIRTELGRLARRMQVSESILCETEGQRDTVRKLIYERGGKCVTRKVEGGYRVWRSA